MAVDCLIEQTTHEHCLVQSPCDSVTKRNGVRKTSCNCNGMSSKTTSCPDDHFRSWDLSQYSERSVRDTCIQQKSAADVFCDVTCPDMNLDQFVKDRSRPRSNGRKRMEHPTRVYGEVTRPWTPVFALLEHKYIDKKPTELGRPKRRGVLFPAGLTYGRPNQIRDGGSSEALHGWPSLSNTNLPFKRKEKGSQRDFMALNRAAVSAGLVTANDQYEFRATHDVRRKTQSEDSQRVRTRRIPPSMVFGISTRPSTPIFDLLEHKYQDKWLQQRRQLELAKRQEENKECPSEKEMQKRMPGQVYETRASLLRTYQNPVEPDQLWHMPKFAKEAKPSLQTFRSAKARQAAYDGFDTDKISRKGNLGHGVYESAKN